MPSSEKSEKSAQVKKADKESKQSSPLDPLKQAYFSVEDKYYELMDYLEDKVRVPVYEYFVEPIEKNGIPSFPVGVLAILLVGLGIFMVTTGGSQTGEVAISLLSASGQAVDGATITLYLGDSAGGEVIGYAKSTNGKATFSGVPLGKPLYVTVSAANFKEYGDSLGEVTADTPTIKISLEDVATQPSVYRLTVVDEDGLPVAGAMVKARSLAGVQVGVYNTDAKGIAKIQLPSTDSLLVTITRTGFSNVTDFGIDPKVGLLQTVTLKKPGSECANGACDKKTTVIVKAINSQQQPVQAQVLLTSSLGSVLGTASTSGGQAALANIPIGTKAIISVTPTGIDLGKYETYYYYDYLVASDDNVVTVTMAASSSSGLSPIFISVADESGKPLAAEVSLYSERSDTPMGKSVARNGDVNFSTDNVSSYATAYAAGYLPKAVSGLKPGSREKLVLRKILAGTAGSIEVQVVDADGSTPVAQAALTVRSSDGRNAGYPAVRTNADGKATIGNVSLGVDYKVYADKSPKKGKSAIYRASEGDATKVTIKLDPTTATLVVSTRDAVNDTGLAATVVAYGTGMSNVSCTTTYYNSYACELMVRAESTVYVSASASYYETSVSPAMVLSTGDSKAYTSYLLPSSIKDQFFVRFTELLDENGKNVTIVDKGRQYDAKFIVNIPTGSSTSKTGLMVRAGTVGKDSLAATDSKEKFAILADGTTVTSIDPIFAATYIPSTSCSNDRKSNSELGYFKWVAFSFAGESGSREITVRILSKTDAASTDKLQINYNGWYSAGGSAGDTYLRSPEDSGFGSAIRSASRDYCYAASSKAVYSVASGRSTCTTSACISLDFSDGTADYGSSFLGKVNTPLVAKVEVRLLKGVQSPRLFAGSDGGNMQVTHYSITTDSETKALDSTAKVISNVTIQMLPFSDPASLSFNLLPVVPVTSGVFNIRFYDGQTELVSAKGYVTLEGEGKMKIVYVKPDRINASQYADVAVKLADANSGAAITDATLSINETSGAPFAGSVPEPMTGSSVFSSGQGYNGIYTFEDLYPTANGVFEVVAEQPNYAAVRQNVTVNSKDFLSVTPIDLDVCGKSDERSIKIRNSLPLNLSIVASSSCAIMSSYVYSQTAYDEMNVPTSYYNATSNVAYDSFSQSYKFTLPESRLGVFTVRPAAFGKDCSIVFNAEGRDKSRAVQTVRYTTCASDVNDKFLSVTPSKVVCTSDEGNCDSSSTITVTNSLSTDVEGTVSVTIKGSGLVLDSSSSTLSGAKSGASLAGTGLATGKSASFADGLISLDSGYTFEMARGASTDFNVVPASVNKTLQLLVTAIAGPRKATAAVEIKNCPGVVDTVAPKIVSSYPTSSAIIDYQPFKILVTTDKAAVCKLDNLYTFPSGSSSQVHTMEMSLNAGTDTAPLAEGQNVFSATCCGLPENGGVCSSSATMISFNFKLKANTTKKANGESCSVGTDCTSGYCSGGVCKAKSSTELCGPNGIVCPESCTTRLEAGQSCKDSEYCCASGYSCDSSSKTCQKSTGVSTGGTLAYGTACDSWAGLSTESYDDPTCKQYLTCGYAGITSGETNGLCTCNANIKEGNNGCPTDAKYCIAKESSNSKKNLCSAVPTLTSDCLASTCLPGKVCDANGKCGTSSGQAAATACSASNTACPTGYKCDTANNVCICDSSVSTCTSSGTPVTGGTSSKLLKYSFSTGQLTDASGAVISTASSTNTASATEANLKVGISSMFPSTGFFVQVTNDLGVDGPITLTLTPGDTDAYLVSVSGLTSASSVSFTKGQTQTLFFAYPHQADVNGLYSVTDGKVLFAAGLSGANKQALQFGVSTTPAKTLKINVVPSIVDTDKYAFTAGLFDDKSKMFVPYTYASNAAASLDTKYAHPKLVSADGTYSFKYLLFNNIMLSANGGSRQSSVTSTASASADAFSYPDVSVSLGTPAKTVALSKTVVNVLNSGSSGALTHEQMSKTLNDALADSKALAEASTTAGTTAAKVFETLKLSYTAPASGSMAAVKTVSFAESCTNGQMRLCEKGGSCAMTSTCTSGASAGFTVGTSCIVFTADCPDQYNLLNPINGKCYLGQTCTNSAWPSVTGLNLPATTLTSGSTTNPSGSVTSAGSSSVVSTASGSGAFPDAFVASIEGGTLRVLRFAYSASGYSAPADVTGTFEYPQDAKLEEIAVNADTKYTLFAYPGQKFNTASCTDASCTNSNPYSADTAVGPVTPVGTGNKVEYVSNWDELWGLSMATAAVTGQCSGGISVSSASGSVCMTRADTATCTALLTTADYTNKPYKSTYETFCAQVNYCGSTGLVSGKPYTKCGVLKSCTTTSPTDCDPMVVGPDGKCPGTTVCTKVSDVSSATVSDTSVPSNSGDFRVLGGSACTSQPNTCASGSAKYCNPASLKEEDNPRLCCASGLSKNGLCVDAGASSCSVLPFGNVGYVKTASSGSSTLVFGTVAKITLEGTPKFTAVKECDDDPAIGNYPLCINMKLVKPTSTPCGDDAYCQSCFYGNVCTEKSSHGTPSSGLYWDIGENSKLKPFAGATESFCYPMTLSSYAGGQADYLISTSRATGVIIPSPVVSASGPSTDSASSVTNGASTSNAVGFATDYPCGDDNGCYTVQDSISVTCASIPYGSYSSKGKICSEKSMLSSPDCGTCNPVKEACAYSTKTIIVDGTSRLQQVLACRAYCTSNSDCAGPTFTCDKGGTSYPAAIGVCKSSADIMVN